MEKKIIFDGDVQKLLDIAMLRPVNDFPFALQPMTKHIQSIGHGWYLLIGTRLLSDGISVETPRACMIIWAVDMSAAILASRCGDSSEGVESHSNELPSVEDFLSTSTGWTYGEIIKAGRGKLMESAVYSANGEFQFKELRLNNSHLYYPSRTRKNSELPMAISLIATRK